MATEREDRRLIESEQQRVHREDIRWLMTERAGRRIVWSLLEEAGVFRSSFDGTETGTYFHEGRRAIGLAWMSKVLEGSRDEFILMLKEHDENAHS